MVIVRNQRPKLSPSSELNIFVFYTLNAAVRRGNFSNSSVLLKVKLLFIKRLRISFSSPFCLFIEEGF